MNFMTEMSPIRKSSFSASEQAGDTKRIVSEESDEDGTPSFSKIGCAGVGCVGNIAKTLGVFAFG